MNYKQFWYDDPDLFWSYLEAYEQEQKQKLNYDNSMAHLSAYYIMLAIGQILQFKTPIKKIFPNKPLDLENKELPKEIEHLQYEEIRKMQLQQLSQNLQNKKQKK
jgi:hypothetical protein